ncbi:MULTISPECIES: hypothetical protein [unclassified Imperialibacter]|uniref:hypothetical protein n=1 Tax=unclassified Imperialibacter TaxID=2629706 RepID=UPI00125F7EE7|nr:MULTISPECIES: hypothetical protein [unclassified Imperialibacter]
MKKMLVACFVIFFAGFFIKFFHIHYNAIVMLAGLFILLAASLIAISKKENNVNGWANLASAFWLAMLLFTIKFYPFVSVVLALAVVFTLVAVLTTAKRKTWKTLTFPAMCLALALTFHLMPANSKYHLLNIRWSYEIDTDFPTWDKYAWFLYQNGKHDEALNASAKALQLATEAGEAEWANFIADHKSRIEQGCWTTFR